MIKQNSRILLLVYLTALCPVFLVPVMSVCWGQEKVPESAKESGPQAPLVLLRKTKQGGYRPLQTIPRNIPTAAPDHPGNVFLLGEDVNIELPKKISAGAIRWRVLDSHRAVIRRGSIDDKKSNSKSFVKVAGLGIGWYRIEFLDAAGEVVG